MNTTLKSIIISSLCLLSAQNIYAQPNTAPKVTGVSVEYIRPTLHGSSILVSGNQQWNQIEIDSNETIYINLTDNQITEIAKITPSKCIATKSELEPSNLVLVSDKDEKIGAWNAKRYKVQGGNHNVELLVTNNIGFTANPCPEYGAINGVVLQVIVDGDITLEAKKINREIREFDLAPSCDKYTELSKSTYRSQLINSVVK